MDSQSRKEEGLSDLFFMTFLLRLPQNGSRMLVEEIVS